MNRSRRPNFWLLAALAVVLVVGVSLVLLASAVPPSPPTRPPDTPVMTFEPVVRDNLTQLPQATPLQGDAAEDLEGLRRDVRACPDYSEQRLSQMEQHIDWLLHPAGIPPRLIPALGENPGAKLIEGMATYTASDWARLGKPRESCLWDIGLRLNTMLVEAGGDPYPAFEENGA